jgi:hypothetical protein
MPERGTSAGTLPRSDEDDTAAMVSPKQHEDLGDHTAGVLLSLSAVSRLTFYGRSSSRHSE